MATAAAAAARGAAADLADSRVQPTASHSSPIIRRADWEALAHAVFACGSSSLVNYVNYDFACGSSSLVNYVNYVNYVFACGSSSLVSIRGDGRTSQSVPAPHYCSGAVTRAASGARMRWYVRREAHAAGSARSGDAARPGEHRRRVVRRRSAEGVKYQRGVHDLVRGVRCERRRSSSGWGRFPALPRSRPTATPKDAISALAPLARVTSMAGPRTKRTTRELRMELYVTN